MIFHRPSVWLLLLLVLLPLVWLRWWGRRRRPALAFSSIAPLACAAPTWAVRARWLVPALRTLAVALLIVCLARPQKPDEQSRVYTEGIAIQLLLDRSGSMRALDFEIDGKPVDRLRVVRRVLEDFITGTGELAGRPDDLAGLIVFAGFADSACPLTLDHAHLTEVIRRTDFAGGQEEDGTAIGDAIALGVERLRGLEQRADVSGRHRIKSRIMVLLTDGESNRGDIDPITAAKMAAAFGIKVYTIGAGSDRGVAQMPVEMLGRTVLRPVPVSIDEPTLREIARLTGAEYFRATDTGSLERIYARIDELEKTTIEHRRYLEFGEAAVQPVRVAGVALPPLLSAVVVLLAVELALGEHEAEGGSVRRAEGSSWT